MALSASTITLIYRRWKEVDIAQLTLGDAYSSGNSPDTDVLEVGVQQAQNWIRRTRGIVLDEDDPMVIEALPIFLTRADMRQQYTQDWLSLYGDVKPVMSATQTDAVAAGSENDTRRMTGQQWIDDYDKGSSARPRRGTRQ